jgi:hypothetical protein
MCPGREGAEGLERKDRARAHILAAEELHQAAVDGIVGRAAEQAQEAAVGLVEA